MNPVIKVEHLRKSYDGVPAVSDLSIAIDKGEVYGLLGANGAGKSTTIECILGTKTSNGGSISILGMDPIHNRKKIFERVGVQFQEATYQEKITVAELCEETQALYKEAADFRPLLKQFGLAEKHKSPVNELSGGQRQRLFIVLALIPKPEIVFLDELTTGLDPKSRRDVWKYLIELKKGGLTILLTSHFMDEVEALCDRIGILKNGKLVFSGTVQEAVQTGPFTKFEDAYLMLTGEEENVNESI